MNLRRILVIAVRRRAAGVAAGCLMAGFGAQALALGLGEPTVSSALGQPLQMSVPLVLDAGGELAQECVRIVPATQQGEAIPSLSAGRVTVDAAQRQIRIESLQPVIEPTLRVVVELGCNERIRREFAVLLDPPAVAPLSAGAAGTAQGRAEPPLGLGMAQISAVLGQRLSLKVPVAGADAASLTAECVRLADPISSEGAPVLRQAQIRVVAQDGGAVVEVATPEPVTEPAVRLALDVGCREPLRREYAILLGLPTLAISNAPAPAETAEAAPPPPAQAAPKPRAKAHQPAAVIATAPESGPKHAEAAPPAPAATKATPPVGGRSDRLVLGSPDDRLLPAAAPADGVASAATDPNAELLRRMDAMSKQIETLQAELLASRRREQELQRQAAETREQWTWSMGALGGLLLGGALVLAWRRRPLPATWEPVGSPQTQGAVTRPTPFHPNAGPMRRETPGIGGRATMPPAPNTTPAPATEPGLAGDEHTQITVTELHDTVQVIKELYATVLERNTANAPTTSGRPSRPLELDLGTPLAAAAAYVPPPNGRVREAPKSRELEERFTELPTEVGLDLDLSTVAMASAPSPLVEFHLPAEASRGAAEAWQLAAAAPPDGAGPAPATPRASIGEGGTRPVVDLAPAKAAAGGFPDEHLTQTPTEVQIDIDVGPTTGFSDTVGRSGGRLGLTRRPEAEAPRKPSLEPIDLQLDLSKPEARIRRRSA